MCTYRLLARTLGGWYPYFRSIICLFTGTGYIPRPGADMITADSLNLDVLEQIFNFLSDHDLPSIALVNQSFSATVVSRLYKTISFRLRHAKGYTNVSYFFDLLSY